MNMVLWVLQILGALLYLSSGVMKVFMLDKVSVDVPSFGALPRNAWTALGVLELICAIGLIIPDALHWHPSLTVLAATILAIESVVFIGVHVKYREMTPIIMSAVLGIVMVFIAYGRSVVSPIV
ncbi:MAG: DoxX family protein [Gemmatimonadaceae bacterium]